MLLRLSPKRILTLPSDCNDFNILGTPGLQNRPFFFSLLESISRVWGGLSEEAFWNSQCQPKVGTQQKIHIEMVSTNSFAPFCSLFWGTPLFIRPCSKLAHLLYLMNTSCKVTAKTTFETNWSNNLTFESNVHWILLQNPVNLNQSISCMYFDLNIPLEITLVGSCPYKL